MRAISLWQPWATLLVAGWKAVETRSRPIPGCLIDQPTAIHAARKRPTDGMMLGCARAWELAADYLKVPQDRGLEERLHMARELIPYGAVVGTVSFLPCGQITGQIIDARPRTPGVHLGYRELALWVPVVLEDETYTRFVIREQDRDLGFFDEGRFVWPVRHALAIAVPVPAHGHRGPWHLEREVDDLVQAQIRTATSA